MDAAVYDLDDCGRRAAGHPRDSCECEHRRSGERGDRSRRECLFRQPELRLQGGQQRNPDQNRRDLDGGYSSDGGPATSAQLYNPFGLVVDATGNLFIADYGNNRVRKVASNGIISTVAGNGAFADSGDGGRPRVRH
jgi:hypothetical protein